MYKKRMFRTVKSYQDINVYYTHRKSDVRRMVEPSILKNNYTEKEFWSALRRELLEYYPRQEVRKITNCGRIIAGFIRQPLDAPDKSSYNKV